ncbi:MAG: polyphosphate kinase [Chitinophagales bacterium]|nr:polyphosphate kinase [Chitinophagales bacterium]MDW8419859.1 polyphosphate kinase [Chitinophagales bacterium]
MARISLSKISTRAPAKLGKEEVKKKTQKLLYRLEELQNLLYAEGKHALLVVLQGLDASGKDGAIKKVFDAVNPMGCRVVPFKRPTELEMRHDFLWRIHQQVPPKGMIHVFNRSHYEDVLVQRVHKWIDEKTVRQRFAHINHFEKLLVESGTVVLKFYLHVSKEEQLQRLQERMSDPTKMWKYNEGDIKERQYWNQYRAAYEDVFANCSEAAPWHIVPADQNWYKEYLIADAVVKALEKLNMKYPGMKTG